MRNLQIGGAPPKILENASVLKIEWLKARFNSKILLKDLKSDRVAGFHVASSKISLIFYGEKTFYGSWECRFESDLKFHRFPGCVVTTLVENCKNKINRLFQ